MTRVRAAVARRTMSTQRLANAETTVALRAGRSGLTLLLDRDPVEVLDGCHEAEITLSLDAEQLDRFSRGDLALQQALLSGDIQYEGPVWRFLRVAPILVSVLSGRADAGVSRPARAPAPGGNGGVLADDLWAIQCRAVSKRFGRNPVLRSVDLGIPEGLITVILGPSGTGKSVLLKHFIGLLEADEGEVLVRGRPLREMSRKERLELRRRFGVLFQDGALWGSMTVFDNVAFPLRQHTTLRESEIGERVNASLADVGLAGAAAAMPAELSGGMRKRAGLARALILEPEIVLFDEPDSGLDPVRTALLCELVAQAHADHGGTFVVITHDIAAARQLAQYMVVLWQGEVVEAGFSDHVLGSANPFVRQFLAGQPTGPLGMG